MNNKYWIKLWSYIRHYKFNSILLRNFVLIMVMIIVPLGGISFYVYKHNDANMRAEIERFAQNELTRTGNSVDMILSEAERLSIRLRYDPDVAMFLNERLTSPLTYYDTVRIMRIKQVLQTLKLTSIYMDSIYVYSEYNDFLIEGAGGLLSSNYNRYWSEAYNKQEKNGLFWVTALAENEGASVPLLSLMNRIPGTVEDNRNGGIFVNMDHIRLGQLIDTSVQEQSIYVVAPDGRIMYNYDSDQLNKTIQQVDIELFQVMKDPFTSRIVKLHGSDQVVTVLPSQSLKGWTYISISSLQLYQEQQARMINLLAVLLTISMCTAVVLAFIIAVRSFSPIRQILSLIEQKENPFTLLGKQKRVWNETGYILSNLSASFNQNQYNEGQLQEKYELLRKAQAIALQAQINPHFLYNTLESINWKAIRLTNGPNEVSQMLLMLSELLRITLDTKEDLVPIRKELEHVRLYIEMQKLRYKNKLSFEFTVDERLLDSKIVKLVLQPLVENAIYFGIKQSSHPGTILIRVYAKGNVIIILVRDNGVGIPKLTVDALNAGFQKEQLQENEHIGLRNVNQRLRLAFGKPYGLFIRSKQQAGTIVELKIPFIRE